MTWKPLGEKDEQSSNNEMQISKLANDALNIEGQSFIHCRYISKYEYCDGGWVNIHKTTFLMNADTKECLSLQQAINIPVSPERYFFDEPGKLKNFTLVFPFIPKYWREFHLVEYARSEDAFQVRNIARNDSGIYHIEIK